MTSVQILQVASVLFARHGFAGTSTRDIAREVGISQPALYKHFGSKQQILRALADAVLDPWLALIERAEDSSVPASARLYWLFDAICRDLATARYAVLPLLTEAAIRTREFAGVRRKYAKVAAAFHDLIAQGTRDGDFRDVDPEFAQRAVLSLTDLLIFPVADPLTRRVDPIVEFALRGLLERPQRYASVVERARCWQAVNGA
jgi:AcrR family transcriptional regulator